MARSGLRNKIALQAEHTADSRVERDRSAQQKKYQNSFKGFNKLLDQAIKIADEEPEEGILISAQCTAFLLRVISEPGQDQGRALFLKQCDTLEHYLALVKNPDNYLAAMQNQFGPNLDARDYAQSDPFNTIIKSQRQRLYTEGQGFNTQEEKNFCRKRSELLAVVEKAYNRLRAYALNNPR